MIHSEWQERLALVAGDQNLELLECVIDHYEPPQTITALQDCVKQAKSDELFDRVGKLSERIISQLANSMGLGESSAKSYAQRNPIYYRLCIRFRGDFYRGLRQGFHTVLQHHAQRRVQSFSTNVQYEDVLALDRCLVEAFKSLQGLNNTTSLAELSRSVEETFPPFVGELQRRRDDLERIGSGDSEQAKAIDQQISRAQEWQRRALELLEDKRTLGDRKRNPAVSRKLQPGKSKEGSPKRFTFRRSGESARWLTHELDLNSNERLPDHETEASERFAHRTLLAGDESRDPAGPRLKIRHEVPYSNRVAQQSQERTALTRLQNDTIVSGSDYHRLSPETLARAFFWLYHAGDSAFVFGWLVATTGLPLKRLRATRVDANAPDGEWPHYDPQLGVLRYQILDGAAPTADRSNRIVVLHLPSPLPELIAQALEPRGSHEATEFSPFASGRATASRQLKRRFVETPGPPVTLRAIKAAALEWLLPECKDEVEALVITGQLGHYHGAADAYRSSTLREVNGIYRRVCARLAEYMVEREPGLRFLYEMCRSSRESAGTNDRIGSARAVGTNDWRDFFSEIRGRARAVELDIVSAPRESQEKLNGLISLYQHVVAYAFIGWSLATAARPTSRRSTILLEDKHAFVVDKSTKSHLERREVPMARLIRQQITLAWQLLEQVFVLAHSLAIVPDYDRARPTRIQLPPWLHCTRLGIGIADISVKRVREWSEGEGHVFHRWPVNAARHSAVSMLRDRVSTVALDALLGHSRGSRDAASTWSGLSLSEVFSELRPAIQAVLDDVGYYPLKVGSYV